MLHDISDERRSAKPGLPADDRDVTTGQVVEDWREDGRGRPRCIRHGAMHRIDPIERIFRCSECGVGARHEWTLSGDTLDELREAAIWGDLL